MLCELQGYSKVIQLCVCVSVHIWIYISDSLLLKVITRHWTVPCAVQFSSVQSLRRVRLFSTPWTAARQASLSITNSRSLFKLMSTELVMPSSHLILCRPLLLLPSIFPSIRVFSNESVICIRWTKYWRSLLFYIQKDVYVSLKLLTYPRPLR